MKTALIIGGGFAGCAAAHQLALKGGWDVTLVEASAHLGGGCRTLWHGGHPHTFGPRHFLTKNDKVWEYLNHYLPMRRCREHEFLTYVEQDAQFYTYPIHQDDVELMPEAQHIEAELSRVTLEGVAAAKNLEDYWISSVGQTLYDKFVNGYSKKMWMLDDNRAIDDFGWSPKGAALKEGPRAAWDVAISAYPIGVDGYDPYFKLATMEAKVVSGVYLNVTNSVKKMFHIGGTLYNPDIVINTISPDVLFRKCHGELPYIGRDFYPIVLPVEFAFPENVYFVYYAGKERFTRIVEYKKFTQHKSSSTLLGLEFPSKHGKYYPMPMKSEYARAQRYFDMMPDGMFSIGRAGSYRYSVDIDDSIEQAMGIAEVL